MSTHLVDQIIFWIKAISFGLLVYLIAWQLYVILFNNGIPNIQTAPAIRKKIIDLLKKDIEERRKDSYTIIDLGSGNGAFTRQMARQLPFAHILGLETNKKALLWSRMRAQRLELKNLDYKEADFFAYSLSEADAVVMYLMSHVMEDMGKKLHKELKKGTLVTSNKFPLGDGWTPLETLRINTLYFHQKYMYVYRKD